MASRFGHVHALGRNPSGHSQHSIGGRRLQPSAGGSGDRVTKFTYVAFFDSATKRDGAEFLREVVQAFPYKSHTVLTDNGVAFTEQPRYRNGATNWFGGHIFDRVCHENAIKHRLTKAFHSGKDGQKIAGHATEGMTKNYQKGHEDVVWSEVEADLDIGEIAG